MLDLNIRDFGSVGEMDAYLFDTWAGQVRPGDTIWVLGDHTGGRGEVLPDLTGLPGRWILLAGNHDGPWWDPSPAETARYLASGFAEVHTGEQEIKVGHRVARMTHLPIDPAYWEQASDPYAAQRPPDVGGFRIHAHTHDDPAWSPIRVSAGGTIQFHAGVDSHAYRLVDLEEVAAAFDQH